ncbi:forkhead box protein O isoform X2 [Cylas formicarius]|uniref:forkhead box protein O isoform X2 n=1 Tax=Cylas formicarius TaxID=197179 RepID=UPI0029583BAF|nr:forkhead box protein O isoform X2 [Cylas formicarius]
MNVSYPGYSPLSKMNLNMLEPLVEHAGDGLEPLPRARSNTWPLPRPENYVDPPEDGSGGGGGGGGNVATAGANGGGNKCPVPVPVSGVPAKKNSSRRNAWGNLSYADLITQAITTSPDKRLTLSQIYEWMVQNVPYFKDKGDSNSSAGWKNSIRHNLSLHNRFMRVQNEGTGKSSWWMINPEAKPGKSVRRRAASMETSKFEKRRGRVKKKVEVIRNGGLPDTTPSPSSSVSESLDLFPDSPLHSGGGFQLSPDFRPRTSSNSSTRLSPIPSVGVEPDWSAQFAGTAFSNPEIVNGGNAAGATGGSYSPDQLAGNLEQRMKLQSDAYMGYLNGQAQAQPPPPYNSIFNDQFPANREFHPLTGPSPYACTIHRMQPCTCIPNCIKVERMSPTDMSPSYPHSEPSPDPLSSHQYLVNRMPRPPSSSPPLTPQSQGTPSTMMGQFIGALNSNDDLNINVDTFQGGFDCNVEEIIRNELTMEGSLDFNFTGQHQGMAQQAADTTITSQTAPPPAYSQTVVTTPSWVH